jgi:hypothetical protein
MPPRGANIPRFRNGVLLVAKAHFSRTRFGLLIARTLLAKSTNRPEDAWSPIRHLGSGPGFSPSIAVRMAASEFANIVWARSGPSGVPSNISPQSVPGTVTPAVDASCSGTNYEIAAYVGCAEMAKVKFFWHRSLTIVIDLTVPMSIAALWLATMLLSNDYKK